MCIEGKKPPCLKNMFERNVQITQQLSLSLMVDILCHAPHIRSDHKHTSLQRFMDDQRAILQPNRGNYDRIDLIEDLKTALVVSGGYATTALSIAHAAENATLQRSFWAHTNEHAKLHFPQSLRCNIHHTTPKSRHNLAKGDLQDVSTPHSIKKLQKSNKWSNVDS